MLKQRLITAGILIVVLLGAIALGKPVFGVLLIAGMGAAAFEWLRLVPLARPVAAAGALAAIAITVWLVYARGLAPGEQKTVFALALGLWAAIAVLVVRAGLGTGTRIAAAFSALACVALLPAALTAAFALLEHGFTLLLSAMAVVWVADTAAYFAGRRWGRAKLAPRISPGKTWAGVIGAFAGVAALALLFYAFAPGWPIYSTRMLRHLGFVGLIGLGALVALAIIGDLFESLLKRQAGVKDSGKLLPGHGGVFDRVDALLPVLPGAALLMALTA
jgi:phosphatidate cytidylyltransferase